MKWHINQSSSFLLFASFTYAEPHPCSRSYGRKTAQVCHLWSHLQACDCFEKARQSGPFENQRNLRLMRKSIYGQEIFAQTSANSSSRSLVTTSSWCCQEMISSSRVAKKPRVIKFRGPALSQKHYLLQLFLCYTSTKKIHEINSQKIILLQSLQSTTWANAISVTSALKVLLVLIFSNDTWNPYT